MTHRPILVWHVAACTALLSALAYCQPAITQYSQSLSAPSKKFALVVGVSQYASPLLPELHYASADAIAMARELRTHGFTVEALTEETATRANVALSLKNLNKHTTEGALTLFYFSGHGLKQDGTSYIAPYNANPDRLDSSALSLKEIYDLLDSDSKTSLIILDACETDLSGGSDGSSMQSSVPTLFSSQPGDASYESDHLGHGVLTYYLLRGLRGDAANNRRLITWRSLVNFAVHEVSANSRPRKPAQSPHAVGPAGEDIILGVADPTNAVAHAFSSNANGRNARVVGVQGRASLASNTRVTPVDVQAQLNNLDYYHLAYQQAEAADALMLSVNERLNYTATHNGQGIGIAQFDECQNTFFTWGQTNALDAIWAPLPSNYADAGVCPSGCSTPFAATINYLSQFPAQNLGLSALSTVTLPNPDGWTLGARTYLLMAFQWPHASGLNTSYLNQLIQIGTNLQQATQNINSTRPTGGQISQNPALFNALFAKHSGAISSLQNAANADVASYENNSANGLTKNGITLSLWSGSSNQTTSWRPTMPAIDPCDGNAAGTGVQTGGQLLTGDKLLFQAYASLGLPNSLLSSDPLHSSLYGSQAVYDGSGVQSGFAGFTSTITDTTGRYITDEVAAVNSSRSQLAAAIITALSKFQTNQLPGSLPQVDVTLQDLQAFVNLQNGNALTPSSFQASPGFASVAATGGSGNVPVRDPYGNPRPLTSYSDLERQEMIRVWDHAVRTGDPEAYRLMCLSYPDSVYCAMARRELYHGADEFRAKGWTAPTPSPTPVEKKDEENLVRFRISTLVTALVSVIALLVTVILWAVKFAADTKEKPKPLITLG